MMTSDQAFEALANRIPALETWATILPASPGAYDVKMSTAEKDDGLGHA
jgi:hypothetical protein